MATARFRFYAELNELLPRARRQRDILHKFRSPATVKDRIEAQGIPHTEVELIQVNGSPVGFAHRLQDGGAWRLRRIVPSKIYVSLATIKLYEATW